MTANKYRGEVAMPSLGDGLFICFDLEDLSAMEVTYGLQFFAKVEESLHASSPSVIGNILKVTLRKRDRKGVAEKIGDHFDFRAAFQAGFTFGDAARPILDALSEAHLGKSYEELVKTAEAARKEQMKRAIAQAKEAASESDVPFEALLSALLMPPTA